MMIMHPTPVKTFMTCALEPLLIDRQRTELEAEREVHLMTFPMRMTY
jgi:hypothetical protein